MTLDRDAKFNDSHLRLALGCLALVLFTFFAVGVIVGVMGHSLWLDWTAAGGWLA